ncbi:Putative serine/threonine-protein kinase drkA [Picochlorum sp. SENEW3]|nr:Putative serine/threonine-protein kinase drkA [Picochlorum sp. SENEW3]
MGLEIIHALNIYSHAEFESRISGRLLRQTSGEVTSAGVGGFFSKAGTFVSESFQQTSILNQAIVVIVMGLSLCMIAFLALIWVAEYLGNRVAKQKAANEGLKTPVESPISVDLESPTKLRQEHDKILQEISASNKNVQLLINESMAYDDDHRAGGNRDARRQLNLKLKAAPSLKTSAPVFRKASYSSPRVSNLGTTVRKRSVSRKNTNGANDHVKIVKPLSVTDLTVIESVKSRDISKEGWSFNPNATRKTSSGVNSPLSVTNIGDSTFKTSGMLQHGNALGLKQHLPCSVSTGGSHDDFRLQVAKNTRADVSNQHKIAMHNSISESTGIGPQKLMSAQSIGPQDVSEIMPVSENTAMINDGQAMQPVARKDTKLGDLILLDPDQFKNEIVLIKLLGTGACGAVHEAIWRGSLVAVKILHPSKQVSQSAVDTFTKEVTFMAGMAQHGAVLKVLAACLEPPNLCLITELADEGSLYSVLHERCLRPEYKTLLNIATDIASAIAFCHGESLVHRDLKTHNILLSSNGKVVVADFGLAVNMEANTMLSNGAGGTALGTASYMAPEQFSGGKVDDKCDAYAFGCILWECITGRQPWEECNNLMQIVMAVGLERRRPPLPRGVPGPLASIIRECWRHNPALRPSMKEIAERLQALKKDEEQALAFKAAASLSIKKSPRQKLGTPRSPLSKGAEWNEKWSPVKGTRMAEIRSGS